MRAAVVALVAILACGAARAQDVSRIDVIEYGIYAVDRDSQGRNAAGIAQATVSNARLAVATHNVPAQRGVTFGFRYKVIGPSNGDDVTLHKVTIFPPAGLRTPAGEVLHQTERTLKNRTGETRFTSYAIVEDFEVVPGVWTIELWAGGRKMASESFTLTK